MPNIEGTGFEGRDQVIRSHVRPGTQAYLVRQSLNPHDRNAIAVFIRASFLFVPFMKQIGYVDKDRASKMAPLMDSGTTYDAKVISLYTEMKHPRVTVSWKARGSKKVKG